MSKKQMGKGDVVVPAGMENSMVLGVEGAGPNTNATGSSKQAYNNVSRLSQVNNEQVLHTFLFFFTCISSALLCYSCT